MWFGRFKARRSDLFAITFNITPRNRGQP